jgi:dipeptidyl aminopeptidase/acylaminoacyl peptidase
MARQKRRITAEDLYRMQLASNPQISPDGRYVVYQLSRVERKTNKQYSNLWVASTTRGAARQFTYGDQNDVYPQWSPDGNQIAFLSNRENDEQSQLYLIPFRGGEARRLTDLKGNFGSYEWSPDGRQIVCNFQRKDEEAVERDRDKLRGELGVVSRRFTRVDYKADGVGFLPHERWHIWTINTRSGKAMQLTHGEEYHEHSPSWSPEGTEIVFLSNRSHKPDLDYHQIDLYVMPATGGRLRKLPCPDGPKSFPTYAPDGNKIAFLCREGKGNAWQNTCLWSVPSDGSAPANNLTGAYDVQVGSGTVTDTGESPVVAPIWSSDGRWLYFQASKHGTVDLCAVTHHGEELHTIIKGGVIGAPSFDLKQAKLAYFRGGMNDLGQIWVMDQRKDNSRQLTFHNQSWLRWVDLGQVEEVWFEGDAGNALQGWILKPPGFDREKKYPSIMEIHGGPWAQYGESFMHEFYFLAAHDYVVYFTNPRGGQGYGEAHSKAIHRNWGSADFSDLMSWTDYLAKEPYVDQERMGVTGGSYGGYMTSWIIGHTLRFKAAVAQRVVSNFISFWGSSDMGVHFEDAWSGQGGPAWQELAKYWEQSPMKYIGNATTPTMVIHSEQDWRCPQEQGEQLFLALREMGVETELVLFPESPHGLSRVGRTDRRIARLNHILRWFEQYLK